MHFNPLNFGESMEIEDLLEQNKNLLENMMGKFPFSEQFIESMMHNSGSKWISKEKKIPVDMIQTKNEIFVILEIPGLISQNDINLEVQGQTLIISGEVPKLFMANKNQFVISERKTGPFKKKVVIPQPFEAKKLSAKYKNGILEITIPLNKGTSNQKITVNFWND